MTSGMVAEETFCGGLPPETAGPFVRPLSIVTGHQPARTLPSRFEPHAGQDRINEALTPVANLASVHTLLNIEWAIPAIPRRERNSRGSYLPSDTGGEKTLAGRVGDDRLDMLKRAMGTLEPVAVVLVVILLFLVAFAGYWIDNSEANA